MSISVVQAPTAEPVTVSQVRANSRIDCDADDMRIAQIIGEAREYLEAEFGLTYSTTTLLMMMDCFPSGEIRLLRGPVQSIVAVRYLDEEATQQTFTDYSVDLANLHPRIAANDIWPATIDRIASVEVEYTAGYVILPARLRAALLLLAGSMVENRESVSEIKLHEYPVYERLVSMLEIPVVRRQ